MSKKRMFSDKIMLSDGFLNMSAAARSLYVTLNLCADDDGLVNNTKSLMRLNGASDENLDELQAGNFIHVFESGVCAVMHWKIHNTIKSDRYSPSLLDEKSRLSEGEKKVYEIHCGNLDPQGRKDKISKDKINKGEERKENTASENKKSSSPEESAPGNDENDKDLSVCAANSKAGYGPYKNVMLTARELAAWKSECPQWDAYITQMSDYLKSKGESYADCLAALRSWFMRDRRKRENAGKFRNIRSPACAGSGLSTQRSGSSYDLEKVKKKDMKIPEYVKRNKKSPASGSGQPPLPGK